MMTKEEALQCKARWAEVNIFMIEEERRKSYDQRLAELGGYIAHDIESRVDVARIRFWVSQFAEALEMPELSDDLEKLLRR